MTVRPDSGLKRSWFDKRDFNFFATFGASLDSLPALPKDGLGRAPLIIRDQGPTNYCTAFTVITASEFQEGVFLSPEFQTAAIGKLAGAPIFGGAYPKDALDSGPKIGSIAQEQSPYTFAKDGWEVPARWENYPDLSAKAIEHAKLAYYSVTYGWFDDYDAFDATRLALWQGRHEKSAVMAYGFWYRDWNDAALGTITTKEADGSYTTRVGLPKTGIMPKPATAPLGRHAYVIFDFKEIDGVQYLLALPHQGTKYGDQGIIYFNRETFNDVWRNPFFNGITLKLYVDKHPDTKPQPMTIAAALANLLGAIIDHIKHR